MSPRNPPTRSSSPSHQPRSTTTTTTMNNRLPTIPQRPSSPTTSSTTTRARRMPPSRAYSSPLVSMQTSLATACRESSLSPPSGSRLRLRPRSPPTAANNAVPSLSSSFSSLDVSLRRRSRSPPGAENTTTEMLSLSCGSLDCSFLEEEVKQELHQQEDHYHHPSTNKKTSSSRRSSRSTSTFFFTVHKHMAVIQKKLHEKAPLLQLLMLVTLLFLVVEAHVGGSFATKQLEEFYEQKSAMLLQLQKVEHHSLNLHQNVGTRLRKAGIIDSSADESEQEQQRDDGLDFDPDELPTAQHPHLKHTSELHQMAKELHLQTAQHKTRLRNEAVDHIHEEYGEGPIKVVLEIEFPPSTLLEEDTSSIEELAIVLYPDTPYASWTWLEQIGRHVWDDATWDTSTLSSSSSSTTTTSPKTTTFGMVPSKPDPLNRGQLKFVESQGLAFNSGDHHHDKWTVGLRSSDLGQLQMFVNLSDNRQALHSHEACVGKILDSFGALQRIVELNNNQSENKQPITQVRIKKAHALHATKREFMSIL